MRQIFQNLSNGKTALVEVPGPENIEGSILIASSHTLISVGTERMLVDFGKAGLIDKARQQPDKVKQVLDKVRTDGLLTTIDAVKSKLDQPIPLGYSNAGIVLESAARGISPGDRVASNGAHAEIVRVPRNLCAKIPDNVDMEAASFTVLGAIGLQGIRLLNPNLGESIAVIGLGLIGQICVQMLRANGCRVLGVDLNAHRCQVAKQFGAEVVNPAAGEDLLRAASVFSRGIGVDGVLITASTDSDEPVHQAAEMCRQRGRVVLAGVTGLNLRRDDFFKKELTFQVSCSYGPGRYDHKYEELGQDYPVGFVRWTEQRNFEAVLDMMASGALNVRPLISHQFCIDDAMKAYQLLNDASALGIIIEYPGEIEEKAAQSKIRSVQLLNGSQSSSQDKAKNGMAPVLGFIGAGNYASRTLIPAFREAGAILDTLVTRGGLSGVHHGKKAGFETATTDIDAVWRHPEINAVIIVTQHNSHASLVLDAIKADRHVFVEKPLCLTMSELNDIDRAYRQHAETAESNSSPAPDRRDKVLMVGFNRRFAAHIQMMKKLLLSKREPKVVIITVNAGEIAADHWTQDPAVGGGRVIGEGCHFIDLMRFLVDSPIKDHQATMIGNAPGIETRDDKVSITLTFEDGSFGTIHYLANGGKAFPKERVEVFCGNAVLQMDNYRVLRGYGWPGFKSMKLWRQDKGQKACAKAFVDAIRQGKSSPISYDEVLEVSRVSIELAEALRQE